MPFRIALNAGHGINTAGKRCTKALDPNETREWELNSRIADKVEQRLSAEYAGYELLRTDDRTGKTDISSKKRINAAAEYGADLYLSLHHNASIAPIISGGGIVAYVVVDPTASSVEWQRALYDALIDSTGLKGNRATPLARANLYELKLAKAESIPTAVLLELGFMTSSADVPVILAEEYADKCAEAIVKVIAERANLTKKAVVKNVSVELPVLKKGMKVAEVKTLQRLLLALGYDIGAAGVDGSFGGKTDAAVRAFQGDVGLTADGSVGALTWTKLLRG